jgi:hypothetical protein
MNVPARGGVNRTVIESPGAIPLLPHVTIHQMAY